eukprot:10766297-Alexandrium_andersonii.AAC.1
MERRPADWPTQTSWSAGLRRPRRRPRLPRALPPRSRRPQSQRLRRCRRQSLRPGLRGSTKRPF